MSVRIGFLGGLGEIGRNCATIEIDGKVALLDCGIMFPDDDMLGIDLVLPDFSSVLHRPDDISCVVLTHGHEDHVGSLAYFLREANVPVYGSELALAFARSRVEEIGVEPDMRPIPTNEWVEDGPFRFTFVRVAHSVPHATGVVFDTPEGIVVHSGDFKLDPTPIDGQPTDLATFAGFGRAGVRLLLSDSTNAERPGFVESEATVGKEIRDLVLHADGRVILACFASHIHRVQQVIDAVVESGRRFVFLGRSMLRNTEIARDLGVLSYPAEGLMNLDDMAELDPSRTAVICTGSQGEPFAALSLMASGQHRSIKLDPTDTVIISATPIPGNETKVSRVINNLVATGADVFHGRNTHVHVSGHAAQDEIKTFVNVLQPQAFIPVHGERRHLQANAKLATEVGVSDVEVCVDGDVVVLDSGEMRVERSAIPAGYVYLDGVDIGEVEDVLRDRRHLADDGVLIVTLGVDISSGEIVIGPDVDSHGVRDDAESIHKIVAESVSRSVGDLEWPSDLDTVRRRVRNTASRAVKKHLNSRPVVIPVIIEV
ncbi:MAG: ribonuclease J [Actinomycetota bacterium]|nr:ribonuclease J [Actinomycetota bacterium]